MDESFRQFQKYKKGENMQVSILVLMDESFRHEEYVRNRAFEEGFHPCFNG